MLESPYHGMIQAFEQPKAGTTALNSLHYNGASCAPASTFAYRAFEDFGFLENTVLSFILNLQNYPRKSKSNAITTGRIFTSYMWMRAVTGLTQKQIDNALNRLSEKGVLSWIGIRQHGNWHVLKPVYGGWYTNVNRQDIHTDGIKAAVCNAYFTNSRPKTFSLFEEGVGMTRNTIIKHTTIVDLTAKALVDNFMAGKHREAVVLNVEFGKKQDLKQNTQSSVQTEKSEPTNHIKPAKKPPPRTSGDWVEINKIKKLVRESLPNTDPLCHEIRNEPKIVTRITFAIRNSGANQYEARLALFYFKESIGMSTIFDPVPYFNGILHNVLYDERKLNSETLHRGKMEMPLMKTTW
jgi:hypothetical protein